MDFLTAVGTVVGVAAMMIYRDWRDGKHIFKRNGSYESQQVLKKILESQKELQMHFNDETTAELKKISQGIESLNSKFDRHLVTEEIFQQNMRDFISEQRRN